MPIETTSIIACANFALACARFIEKYKTRKVLESVESNVIQIRDRKVKAGVNLLNDARNCCNESNMDYYMKTALSFFVEGLYSYDIEKEYARIMNFVENEVIRDGINDYAHKIPGYSKVDNAWKNSNEKSLGKDSFVLEFYETACMGAGICSFYLKEYQNSFSYFDKALFITAQQYRLFRATLGRVFDNIGSRFLLSGRHRFPTAYEKMVYNMAGDTFCCMITLENYGINNIYNKDTNLYCLERFYVGYKEFITDMYNMYNR